MKKTVILKFEFDEGDSQYDYDCAAKGVSLNGSIYDALQAIRGRLKYSEDVSEVEYAFLESLRSTLSEHYVEG